MNDKELYNFAVEELNEFYGGPTNEDPLNIKIVDNVLELLKTFINQNNIEPHTSMIIRNAFYNLSKGQHLTKYNLFADGYHYGYDLQRQ